MADYLEWPWQKRQKKIILPIFIPFMGCPAKCLYCAQDLQTGHAAISLEAQLQSCREALTSRQWPQKPQIAFYGGTFTSIPEHFWARCLNFAKKLKAENLISGFRCSTRPDSISGGRLDEMLLAGCEIVELGIQSFDDKALLKTERGYGREECLAACESLKSRGVDFGVQLMPGMPGVDRAIFIQDVELAADLGAACARFYPCLVIGGTRLHELWQKGGYSPWELEYTLEALAEGWAILGERGIPVIRMGVAPQPEMEPKIMAGPRHPALGSQVRARGTLFYVTKKLAKAQMEARDLTLYCPDWTQGEIRGLKNDLDPAWKRLGITKISFWPYDKIRIARNQG